MVNLVHVLLDVAVRGQYLQGYRRCILNCGVLVVVDTVLVIAIDVKVIGVLKGVTTTPK
jgi:hypothetical protein